MNPNFSFIILTFNEEQHLPRLLNSIQSLNARVYILDSGSTDKTIEIARDFGAELKVNPFVNHPIQWNFALSNFKVDTPWTIGLDADQVVTSELISLLTHFKDEEYNDIDGIFFNRKNYFRGKWIRFGGFYPKYLLKMFRTGIGYSDLNENMDHRFVTPGKKSVWKKGHIVEENLKENKISFWIEKHNRYSDLVAEEELERAQNLRKQENSTNYFGNPDEKMAFFKKIWWRLPLGWRPFFYLVYRLFFKLGVLDGRTGVLFHFLQGFWFRLIVDLKIQELQNDSKRDKII